MLSKKWFVVQFFHNKTVSSVFTQPPLHFMSGWSQLLIFLFILQTAKQPIFNTIYFSFYIVYCTHYTVHRVLYSYNLQLYCIVHKAEFFWWKAARAGHKQILQRHRVTKRPEVLLPDLYCPDCPFSGVNTVATDPSPILGLEEGNCWHQRR